MKAFEAKFGKLSDGMDLKTADIDHFFGKPLKTADSEYFVAIDGPLSKENPNFLAVVNEFKDEHTMAGGGFCFSLKSDECAVM